MWIPTVELRYPKQKDYNLVEPKDEAAQPDISLCITYNHSANGGDRLRQGFGRPTDVMPGYSMQLVKKRREKTIANNNELALAA